MGCDCRENHLPILSSLSRLLNSDVLSEMQAARNAQDVYDILCRFEQSDIGGLA
jgi:mannitol/fructose-specific phosphotransferase system IIA component (Ntr-type)